MKVQVTLYKDNVAVYTEGVKMELDSDKFSIRGTGYISTVNFFDLKPDLNFPHILATELDLNDGRKFYVSETREEIEAQIATTGNGNGNLEVLVTFVVGDPGAPANEDTQYINTDVTGNLLIEKNGVGALIEGTDYDLLPGGGFELLGGGMFTTGEIYTVSKINN